MTIESIAFTMYLYYERSNHCLPIAIDRHREFELSIELIREYSRSLREQIEHVHSISDREMLHTRSKKMRWSM
jgi:hypothetical protein